LYNLDGKGAFPKDNTGIYEITGRPEDMGKFRAPTLRNIAVTAPYMHDGSIATLEEALDHYAAGGRTIRNGGYKGIGSANPNKSAFVKGFKLTAREKRDVIAFLRSLTDEKFLTDARFSDPWKSRLSEPSQLRKNADQALRFDPLPNPVGPGSLMSNLTVTPDQRLLLSWVEQGNDQSPALRYAIARNGLWSEAQTVTSRQAIVGYQSARPVVTLLPDVPKLRIVRYEEALDFPDWTNRGEKVPLVRLLARKG
jgi:hypothetical protein